MRKIAGIIFTIYAFAVFLLLMLLAFPFVLFASLLGKIRGGNTIYDICRVWADITLFMWGINHKNYYDFPKSTDHAVVFVFNHLSYIDIPLLLKVFRRQPIRILGKAEMTRIPIFGYIYKKAVVQVQRTSTEARAKSVNELKEMLKKNISVVIAPEGTFNTTDRPLKDFFDGAFKIAIETQTSIQPVIFLDAYSRLNYSSIFSLTPGTSRAVFLEEVDISQYGPPDVERLKQKVYGLMETALVKYNAPWIKEY